MQNPFESGHIKNYLLLYVSVVVIMILFFIASSLFNEVETKEKKVFNTEMKTPTHVDEKKEQKPQRKFKLLKKSY